MENMTEAKATSRKKQLSFILRFGMFDYLFYLDGVYGFVPWDMFTE